MATGCGVGEPADKLLTAEDLGEIMGISRSAAYELLARIPWHVRIGLGKRQQLRLPRWALDRWIKNGGDKWQSSEGSREAPIGTQKAATATASDGASQPSRLRAMPPPESPEGSSWKERFRGYNRSTSRKRSTRSTRTRKENG